MALPFYFRQSERVAKQFCFPTRIIRKYGTLSLSIRISVYTVLSTVFFSCKKTKRVYRIIPIVTRRVISRQSFATMYIRPLTV